MDNFEKIRQLRDEHESALDEAARLRDAYHREIVKLHRSGLSLREIADELGLSHQRVHQIVAPHEDAPRARSRRGVVAGAIVAALVLASAIALVSRGSVGTYGALTRPSISPVPAVRCAVVSSNGRPSVLSRLEMAAACKGAHRSVVVLDPKTGKILKDRSARQAARQAHVIQAPPPPPYVPCAAPC